MNINKLCVNISKTFFPFYNRHMAISIINEFFENNDLLRITTGNYEPGEAEKICDDIDDPELRLFAEAELCYYRGELSKAFELFSALESSDRNVLAAASTLGIALTSLFSGNAERFIDLYNTVKDIDNLISDGYVLKFPTKVFLLYTNILVHNFEDIRFPPIGLQSFDVPEPIKPMAFYTYTHYLLETGDPGRAIGMAEGALIFMKKPSPISEIYLCLIIARGYMFRKVFDKAEHYFRLAWSLAEPDGLLVPFAEFRGMLFGLLEKCLRYEKPEQYKKIAELSNVYHSGWVSIHNELTGETVSDRLTAIEFNVATLAARGETNTEISDFLGISVNSVRAHLRNIFNKLGISSRKDIDIFVI